MNILLPFQLDQRIFMIVSSLASSRHRGSFRFVRVTAFHFTWENMRTLFLVAILFVAVSLAAFPTKKLAGPPSEFSTHRMPNPGQNPLLQRSVTEYVWLKKQDGSPEFAATLSIPVDGPGEFVWTLASPYAEYLKIVLKDPQGAIVDLTNALIEVSFRCLHICFIDFKDLT